MSQYLLLRCGTIECLLDIVCVQEVALIETSDDKAGHGLWRGQSLPVTSLGHFFQQDSQPKHQLVVQENDTLRLLAVDAVLGLLTAAADEFQSFTSVTPAAQRCFDLALPQADGRCLLRLRRPLTWLDSAGLPHA